MTGPDAPRPAPPAVDRLMSLARRMLADPRDYDEAPAARAALALVEQWGWHAAERTRTHSASIAHEDEGLRLLGQSDAHADAAARLLAAIEKAGRR